MKRILVLRSGNPAIDHYRSDMPVRQCAKQLQSEGIDLRCADHLDLDEHWDGIVFHRFPQDGFFYQLKELIGRGCKIGWELDDDYWNVPAWNPAAKDLPPTGTLTLDTSVGLAHLVIVSTERLAQQVRCRPDKVVVCPNLIDPSAFRPPDRQPGAVRVLWAGSLHHSGDLQQIVRPVKRLVQFFGSRVQFLFWGYLPDGLGQWQRVPGFANTGEYLPDTRRFGRSVGYIEGMMPEFYFAGLTDVAADIGIAPLSAELFNRSKSPIKFLEMTCAGAAFVGTDIEAYQCVRDGVDGCLVPPGDEDGWYRTLYRLIEDDEMRGRLWTAAKAKVAEEHSWKARRSLWLNAFRRLVGY